MRLMASSNAPSTRASSFRGAFHGLPSAAERADRGVFPSRLVPLVAAVLGTVAVGAGCKSRTFHESAKTRQSTPGGARPAPREIPEKGESWGTARTLRDDSALDGGDAEKPDGGWWVTPIHANLLPSGKVLVTGWARRDEKKCELLGTRRYGRSFVLDPEDFSRGEKGALKVAAIDEKASSPSEVLYCAGHVPLGKGKVLFAGGAVYENLGLSDKELEFGLSSLRVYDDATKSFSRSPDTMASGPDGMPGWAWYPTLTRLADGRVLVSNGYARCCDGKYFNHAMHVVDPAKAASGAKGAVEVFVPHREGWGEIAPGLRDYTHTFALPEPVTLNGRPRDVVSLGWPGKAVFMDTRKDAPAGPGWERFAVPPNASRPSGSGWDSSALLVGTGEIVTVGGTSNPPDAAYADFYDPKSDTWSRMDLGIGRRNPSTVLLPDGRFLVMSGEDGDKPYSGDRKRPQIVDPYARTFSTLAPWSDDALERGYHNFAVLLKDGRILLGGGVSANGGIACERTDVRIFVPPYLDPTKGPRPKLAGIAEGSEVFRGTGTLPLRVEGAGVRAERGFALMALGSITHSFDQNQRYVPLEHESRGGGAFEVRAPAGANAAPPGDYLLFAVSEAGVPSVGVHVVVPPLAGAK